MNKSYLGVEMLFLMRSLKYLIVGLLVVCGSIYIYGSCQKVDYADIGIVLGNQVLSEDQPSERLRARLDKAIDLYKTCLLYTSPSPRDKRQSRMPSSA